MHLPYLRRMAPHGAQRWDPTVALKALLGRRGGWTRTLGDWRPRGPQTAFPTGKAFATWDANLSSISRPTQTALRTLEWTGRRENLVICGPPGTGKAFWLEGLGQLAVEARLKVAGFSLENLGVLVRRQSR